MAIKTENIASFELLFQANRKHIRASEGCCFLALYRDRQDPTVFFTHSHWKSEKALEDYRESEFFKHLWGKTKKLFRSAPEAWSLHALETLN